MCYSGHCRYENRNGDCVCYPKFPEDALCVKELKAELKAEVKKEKINAKTN